MDSNLDVGPCDELTRFDRARTPSVAANDGRGTTIQTHDEDDVHALG